MVPENMWSTGEGNGKPLQYSCLENPMNSMKRQKDMKLKDELPWSVCVQYATGEEWRNNSIKTAEMEPKGKQYQAVDVTGDGSKVQCCKEQYCIGTWNVSCMNQGKLEVVKQEMAIVNLYILGISELKWTGMGEFHSDDHYIYFCRQESLTRNGVPLIVNKRVQNIVPGCNLKYDRMERRRWWRSSGRGVHLSPRIYQEHTFRHRSACKTPAENGQEYLTNGKEYIKHARLSRMKELGGKPGVLVGLDVPLVGGGTEAGVQSSYHGNCLSQRRNI